uniref:Tissue factor pathway inhibitor 2 n=1 Tax=Magallana gigas TaxID=29159 RepID=K1RCH9_MAGGI
MTSFKSKILFRFRQGGVCSLRPDVGECEGICPRFYYDARRRTCRRFNYGCCGGNANNFKTKALCQRVCGRRKRE